MDESPKYIFTKDGYFKLVREKTTGKSRVFVPLTKPVEEPSLDIDVLASKLADRMLSQLLARLPQRGIESVNDTTDSIVQMDESVIPITSDISDIVIQEDLVEKDRTKDNSIEQSRNKLKRLKGK